LFVALALLLSACASRLKPAQQAAELDQGRLAAIAVQGGWVASGRLAASNGEDSGQLRFRWRETPLGSDIFLRAPMGQGSWRLQVNDRGAWLEDGEGNRDWAEDAQALLQARLGWSMPVALLRGWLTGVPGPTAEAMVVAENGAPFAFAEQGWQVQYQDYTEVEQVAVPRRVEVVSGQQEARLLVAQWQWLPAE
jgi:outer membrane lipoprotein LolB